MTPTMTIFKMLADLMTGGYAIYKDSNGYYYEHSGTTSYDSYATIAAATCAAYAHMIISRVKQHSKA